MQKPAGRGPEWSSEREGDRVGEVRPGGRGPDVGPGGCMGPAHTLAFPLSDTGGQHCRWQPDVSFPRLALTAGSGAGHRREGEGERPVSRLWR